MKNLCKNCGAKIPKNSDVCKKCGQPYEYIELDLDPETQKLIEVKKPSNTINICILLLSILIFAYSVALIYMKFTGKDSLFKNETVEQSSIQQVEESSETEEKKEEEAVHYNAIEFIGETFGDVKKVLGEQYSIKLSDTTLVAYTNVPVTLSTIDQTLTDDSVISSVIVKENGCVSLEVSADMTYQELKSILGFKEETPVLNEADSYYYVYKVLKNDNYQMNAAFKFDDESLDKAPLEIILTCDELTIKKITGVVKDIDEDSSLNVRAEASYDSETLYQLVNDDEVVILDEITDADGVLWYMVECSNGITGYSSAEFIEKKQDEAAPEQTEEESSEDEEYDSEYESEE